jgi:hypothetical protein
VGFGWRGLSESTSTCDPGGVVGSVAAILAASSSCAGAGRLAGDHGLDGGSHFSRITSTSSVLKYKMF